MPTATMTYIKKTIERLYGIIEGISIDYEVNDKEIIALKNWIDTHNYLHDIEPFRELGSIIEDILEDGVIDEQEREDLLDWCSEILNDRGFIKDWTQITRNLHGVLQGIGCDKVIKSEELEGLKDWLIDYECLKNWWPFNDIRKHINIILKDGKIDKKEQQFLKILFNDFKEQLTKNQILHDDDYWDNDNLVSPSPIFKSIKSICEKNPKITFKNKKFCFTGPAASGKRKDLSKIVKILGGISHNTVVKNLDYLVIGAQASPAWVYSTYGRKIESVINRQKQSSKTIIINEYDFIKAVKNMNNMGFITKSNKKMS